MIRRQLFRAFVLGGCLFLLGGVGASRLLGDPIVVRALVPQDVIDDYTLFLAGRSASEVQHYTGPHARRDVVELVLLEQALSLGGADCEVEWVALRSYEAIFQDVASGRYAMAGTSVWAADAEALSEQLLISTPVLREGSFIVGFYTAVDNTEALLAQTLPELQKLSAVSNREWGKDWDVLDALGVETVYDMKSWDTMVRMLCAHRADFTFAPFNNSPGMLVRRWDCELRPIEGMKACLPGERVFVVSKQHPEGTALYAALQSGLKQLHEAGVILRAYTECGLFNPLVEDWVVLKCEM